MTEMLTTAVVLFLSMLVVLIFGCAPKKASSKARTKHGSASPHPKTAVAQSTPAAPKEEKKADNSVEKKEKKEPEKEKEKEKEKDTTKKSSKDKKATKEEKVGNDAKEAKSKEKGKAEEKKKESKDAPAAAPTIRPAPPTIRNNNGEGEKLLSNPIVSYVTEEFPSGKDLPNKEEKKDEKKDAPKDEKKEKKSDGEDEKESEGKDKKE